MCLQIPPHLSVARQAYHDMLNEMAHAISSSTGSQAHVNTADVEVLSLGPRQRAQLIADHTSAQTENENAEAIHADLLTERQTSDYRGINTELQAYIVDPQDLLRDPAHAIKITCGAESQLSLSVLLIY